MEGCPGEGIDGRWMIPGQDEETQKKFKILNIGVARCEIMW